MEIIKIHCNHCGGLRKHHLRAKHEESGEQDLDDEGRYSVSWINRYQVLECGGCESISFRHMKYFSEWDWFPYESGWVETLFPPRYSRPLPDWLDSVEDNMRSVLMQTYQALYADMLILATFGARTAIDLVITKLVGDAGSFVDKMKKMVDKNLISEEGKVLFNAVIEAGNAAAHRGYEPNRDLLGKVIDILEAVIVQRIVHPAKVETLTGEASKILKEVPKRVKTKEAGARPIRADSTGNDSKESG